MVHGLLLLLCRRTASAVETSSQLPKLLNDSSPPSGQPQQIYRYRENISAVRCRFANIFFFNCISCSSITGVHISKTWCPQSNRSKFIKICHYNVMHVELQNSIPEVLIEEIQYLKYCAFKIG